MFSGPKEQGTSGSPESENFLSTYELNLSRVKDINIRAVWWRVRKSGFMERGYQDGLLLFGSPTSKIFWSLEESDCIIYWPRWFSGKESSCQARDEGLIPGSGRSPGEGNSNPLQYSCLVNPMDREAYSSWGHKRVRHNLETKQQKISAVDLGKMLNFSNLMLHHQWVLYTLKNCGFRVMVVCKV